MGGYSKIKIMGASSSSRFRNSRSVDFSDLQSFSQTQKSTPKNPTSSKIQEETNLKLQHMKKNNTTHDSAEKDCQNKGNGGERFGTHVMLRRNSSASSFSSSASASASATGLGLGLGLGFQSALKGVFSSMRRSSSASERYCRIHDQSATTALTSSIDDNEEDDEDHQATRSTKKKHEGGGKILKLCKRFFRM